MYEIILYNDSVHSFQDVIFAISTILSIPITQAEQMAYIIDGKGFAVVRSNIQEESLAVEYVRLFNIAGLNVQYQLMADE